MSCKTFALSPIYAIVKGRKAFLARSSIFNALGSTQNFHAILSCIRQIVYIECAGHHSLCCCITAVKCPTHSGLRCLQLNESGLACDYHTRVLPPTQHMPSLRSLMRINLFDTETLPHYSRPRTPVAPRHLLHASLLLVEELGSSPPVRLTKTSHILILANNRFGVKDLS